MADMLITPEELASYLQRDLDNRATAELLIVAATGVVQAECRQRLVAVAGDTVHMLDGGDGMWLELPERPVTAVTAVTVNGLAVTDWTSYVDPRTGRGRLWRSCGWRARAGLAPVPIVVTYSHGYPTGSPDLELARMAVLSLSASAFGNPDRVQSEQIDDYAVRWAVGSDEGMGALNPNVARALRRRYGVTAGSTRLAAS